MINPNTPPSPYESEAKDRKVVCRLCPHGCELADGEQGRCRVRRNDSGHITPLMYGLISSLHTDPMEKKPLYHFHPGEAILSLGSFGCNLSCVFCQNHTISQQVDESAAELSPADLVRRARQSGSIAVAYTYNEPLVNMEYVCDCARLVHEAGLKNVIVSNGFINPRPLNDLMPYLDAANIDVKGDDQFYRRLCGGRLAPVLQTIQLLHDSSIHVETTTLLVSGENDTPDQTIPLFREIADISDRIPLHISRYFPQYRFSAPPTSAENMANVTAAARTYLHYVYTGNTAAEAATDCLGCGRTLIRRAGGQVHVDLNGEGRCPHCGVPADIVR